MTDETLSRRDALVEAARRGAVLAVPVTFAVGARKAFGQGLPTEVREVLTFALTLEELEADFYRRALRADGLIPREARAIFRTNGAHEEAHVEALRELLGSRAPKESQFDFTAGGMFQPFENYEQLLLLAQAFEDLGVRAYKGQVGKLVGMPELLTTALKIHSVESRHAAAVRVLRDEQGWIPLTQPGVPAAVEPVYAEMAQTEKFGVALTEVSEVGERPITEAFDEPLDMESVLEIARPFLRE